MPSVRALAFIALRQAGKPPGYARATAWAARFSDDIKARWSRSPRLRWLPIARREAEVRSSRRSSGVNSILSSRGCPASRTTRAVMSLVIEAIGTGSCACLEYSTEESAASRTMTELERTSSLPKCFGWTGSGGIAVPAGEAKVRAGASSRVRRSRRQRCFGIAAGRLLSCGGGRINDLRQLKCELFPVWRPASNCNEPGCNLSRPLSRPSLQLEAGAGVLDGRSQRIAARAFDGDKQ